MPKHFYDKIKPVKYMCYLECSVNIYTKQFLTAAAYPRPLGSPFGFTVFTYEVTVCNVGYFF